MPCQKFPIGGLPFEKCERSDVYGNSPEFSYQDFRATISPGTTGETRLEVLLGSSRTDQGYVVVRDYYSVGNTYPIDCRKLRASIQSECPETFRVQEEEARKNIEINGFETTLYRFRVAHET